MIEYSAQKILTAISNQVADSIYTEKKVSHIPSPTIQRNREIEICFTFIGTSESLLISDIRGIENKQKARH